MPMKNKRARTSFATTPHQYSRSTLGAQASRPQEKIKRLANNAVLLLKNLLANALKTK